MAAERRTIWLGVALVVAIGAFLFARSMSDPQAAAGRRNAPARANARGAAQDAANDSPATVNLAQLSQTRGEPAEAARNPFRFRPKPAPPPPQASVSPGPAQIVTGPPAPSVPAGPPPPPPIALKFIGIVQKADGTRIAVLSDGKRPYYGVDGQEIEGQYRILKIGQESVEIAYIDGRGRQTLRLNGQ